MHWNRKWRYFKDERKKDWRSRHKISFQLIHKNLNCLKSCFTYRFNNSSLNYSKAEDQQFFSKETTLEDLIGSKEQ